MPLIGFTYSPIHQIRHNLGFFRNYCAGGTLKETGVRALRGKYTIFGSPVVVRVVVVCVC
jgi:hypothetical protein